MKKIQLILVLFLASQLNAQFLNEIGFFAGGTNYSGDIGNEMYIMPNRVGGSIVYKRNVNSRISIRTTASYLPIAADDANSSNIVRQHRNYSFSNTIVEVAMGIEFSYFDYDITSSYNNYTPYIVVEFAGMYYDVASSRINGENNYTNKMSYAIPFGLGFKSKITDRIAYAVESRAHYTFVDDLDFNNENIPQLNFGNPNNNDWYFFTGVSLVYSFGRPPCAVTPRY